MYLKFFSLFDKNSSYLDLSVKSMSCSLMLGLPVLARFWFFTLSFLSISCSVILARAVLALRPLRPRGYPEAAAVAEHTLMFEYSTNSNGKQRNLSILN